MNTKRIILKSSINDIGGYKKPSMEPQPVINLDEKLQKKIDNSRLNTDQFIAMTEFAEYLPRGNRKLKLNMPELRDELLSNQKLNALTNSDGLRTGGMASYAGNEKAKVKPAIKDIKEDTQRAFMFSIKNNNRVQNEVNFNKFNPNYTSFKNNFSLR